MLPLLAAAPPKGAVDLRVAAILILFALLCSAVAYLIYYRLMASLGPTRTLTVTFLMPVFGMLLVATGRRLPLPAAGRRS